MKARKTLKNQALIQEVISQISQRFAPKIPDIKKALDTLLEKEYIERVEGTRDTFAYVAWVLCSCGLGRCELTLFLVLSCVWYTWRTLLLYFFRPPVPEPLLVSFMGFGYWLGSFHRDSRWGGRQGQLMGNPAAVPAQHKKYCSSVYIERLNWAWTRKANDWKHR